MPRYALPNISFMLPEYTNHEQDIIRRAFANNNCDSSLSDLPAEFYTNEVSRARARLREEVRERLASAHEPGTKSLKKAVNSNGLFQEFQYVEDPIELAEKQKTAERLANEAKRLSVHPEQKGEFVPPGNVYKLTYEDGFDANATYPYSVDPYEAFQDDALRNKWMEESKVLYGAFVPSGTDKPLKDRPTKAAAREVIDAVARVIAEDWGGSSFTITANEEEHWVIQFRVDAIDSEAGLLTYMNILLRCNDMVLKHGLRKVIDGWNVRVGEYIQFTVSPPWAECNAMGKAWYKLHPSESKFTGKSWMNFRDDSQRSSNSK